MKNLLRLLFKGPNMYIYYMKISGSVDFMLRYTILGIIYLTNALLRGKLWRLVQRSHKLFDKAFIFNTPFGNMMWKNVTHRSMLLHNYEPQVRNIIINSIERTNKERRIALNIGAHIGRYTVELANMHWYIVHAFEPHPDTFRSLKINTILNRLEDKVILHNYALADTEWDLDFEYMPLTDGSSHIVTQWSENTIKVPVRSFDNIGISDNPSLIIMDVEGFEYNVLLGMKESLSRYTNVDIVMEMFHDAPHKEELLSFMKELGYEYHMIDRDNHHFKK